MALADILAQPGDGQDFVVEIPAGNAGYIPKDFLIESGTTYLCAEIPLVTGGGGGNIFIMAE